MAPRYRYSSDRQRMRGAAAIEFAFIFPVLFMLVYAGIAYGYLYFMQQRINFAAQEGVRAAIAVDPATPNYSTAVTSQAVAAALATFTAGGETLPAGLTATKVSASSTFNFAIQVQMPVGTLFPTVTFPGLGTFPIIPANLVSTAEGRLS